LCDDKSLFQVWHGDDHFENAIDFKAMMTEHDKMKDLGKDRGFQGSLPRNATRSKTPEQQRRSKARADQINQWRNESLTLVESENYMLSAESICRLPVTISPDYADFGTGKFCHMSEHTVWDFCGNGKTDHGFDTDRNELLLNGKHKRGMPYAWVEDYRPDSTDRTTKRHPWMTGMNA
jgi:hypothetical protein